MNAQILSVKDSLQRFSSHKLEDLDRAVLMNRVDTKFLLPVHFLPEILLQLNDDYSILQIENKRLFHYQSIYFDTSDLKLYHMHHRGKLERFKVRLRSYLDFDKQFLEVKRKNNKKRTLKSRIEINNKPQCIESYRSFVNSCGFPFSDTLTPSLENHYYRFTLASEERAERLTIDLDLNSFSLRSQNQASFETQQMAIVELKQAKLNRNTPFYSIASNYGFRPTAFSKYCIGLALTENKDCQDFDYDLKSNRFKPIVKKVLQCSAI